MTKVDLSKFKMLTEVEHVLHRPGRYIGSTETSLRNDWFIEDGKVVHREARYNPGFCKLFDEIISNSADHSKKPEGAHLNRIDVSASVVTGEISVYDNGGIPVQKHPDNGLWIPDMIFGHLRSGTNFDDDPASVSTGQNGEGSSLTNIFSTVFDVETWDGSNSYSIQYGNNMTVKRGEQIKKSKEKGTRITYTLDWPRFGMVGLDAEAMAYIERRCYEIAATNPHLKVSFNGKPLKIDGFEAFVKMFDPECVIQNSDRWRVGLTHSDDGFSHISFVNSTMTFEGGTHIEYVMEKVVEAIREHIEKKTKQKVKPSEIQSQFKLFLDCTITNPRYSSQTKENLITPVNKYGSQFILEEKTVKALIASPMMKKIIAWAERRRQMKELEEAEKQINETRSKTFYHIDKYHPATEKNKKVCRLFLCEGDSAAKPLVAAKGKQHGIYPLRGKPLNCFDKSVAQGIKSNVEFANVLMILGIPLNGIIDQEKLRYSEIVISTDADHDGAHIRGLLLVMFSKYWPEVIENGMLKFLKTPIITAKKGNTYLEFFTEEEYDKWVVSSGSGFVSKRYKGLGSWEPSEMKKFMNDPKYTVTVKVPDQSDLDMLNMAFNPNTSEQRKNWLNLHV